MENRTNSTKSTVEAGLISAIIVVLMLITGYVPMIAFLGTLILPIPVAILYLRHNFKVTLTAIIVSTIITAMLFNPIQAALSALSFGFTGLVFGYSIRKNKSINFTLIILTLASLLAIVINFLITILIIQKTSITGFFTTTVNQFNDMMKETIPMVKELYVKAGMTEEQINQSLSVFNMLTPQYILNFLAAALIMQSIVSSFVNYAVSRAVLRRFGYNLKKFTPFTEFYINSFIGALIVMPVPLGVLLSAKNIPIGKPILVSGQVIMQFAFLLVGISVVSYYLKNRFKLTNAIITIIVIFLALNPMFGTILVYLGLIDMLFDFRKINPNRILKK
ncbi:YybS family protein [Clostridium sp. YIM B02515]|uniref:YybS family protein n=1 Tax=Clostridium rhizosphaerae TaxID=2803861 RepID=A0ABS1TDV3_9CLOT|nr:YybS family protein [Clostridium rhizosphaerae]MBL4937480.1 YybS family protein [Clostridium rhizosphaerae]